MKPNMRSVLTLFFLPVVSLVLFGCSSTQSSELSSAPAIVETDPVPGGGDSGDDMAIWLHPKDLSKSALIGTDSKNGLAVYDLSGKELAFYEEGATGMVDVRYNFPLGEEKGSIIAAGNHSSNQIMLYRMEPETRQLVNVSARPIRPELSIYGTCMYHSSQTGNYYVFVTSEKGEVEQWRLSDDGNGKVDARQVRKFTLNPEGPDNDYTVEGCVADDELGRLYLAQEDAGRIWRVSAAPSNLTGNPTLVDKPKSEGGHTIPDVEGLSLYYGENGTGYLVANNQGDHTYTLYTREGNNDFVMNFAISGSDSVDAVESDDSIDITSAGIGPTFSNGLVVVEDGNNTAPGSAGHDNYKLVRWEDIAMLHSPSLTISSSWDPRRDGEH